MDQDDDVEHLFSWLQTPELRYREFAGAREITDAIVSWQPRPDEASRPVVPGNNVQLAEEYPPDQFPDQTYAPADVVVERGATVDRAAVIERSTVIERAVVMERGAAVEHSPAMIAPMPMPAAEPPAPTVPEGPFGLGPAGRASLQDPVIRPPLIQVPAPRQDAPPVLTAAPVQPPLQSAPSMQPPPQPAGPAAGGLLGGSYRQNGSDAHPAATDAMASPLSSPESQQRTQRSLDAVFGRLADARSRLPDPRERLRHVPGMSPPSGRPR
jgi:hypothetical protein